MKNTLRIVQIIHKGDKTRKVAVVEEPVLILVDKFSSTFELVQEAISSGIKLSETISRNTSKAKIDYGPVYEGKSDWKLLPPIDHPGGPDNLMLSGTGLTHKASADNRQKMHVAQASTELTDSMKMFLWGLEGGHPAEGETGVQPEWFYKGNGSMLRGHGDLLEVPEYADDGGEEAEIAGVYVNDENGKPWRIGLTTANEFSDHVMEKKNYLYLAPSKIRNCSIGPELVIDPDFTRKEGQVKIYRGNRILWESRIFSGEENMSHSLQNLEYHHFKYDNHRLPGQIHVHFFGADAFSFGEGIALNDGDKIEIQWMDMGRPLVNYIRNQPNNGLPIAIQIIT